MSCFGIRLEVRPGTTVKVALAEAKQKAIQFNVSGILFNINGTEFLIYNNSNLKKAFEDFHKGIKFVTGL